MWTYRQPAFALQLLYELQKQQQGGLHCDLLLQTEGMSVPVHSCVLAALSPVLSRVLTNSPSYPVGHSRVLNVQTVRTSSLLKLVGFMYSGEVEGEGLVELEEVTDIAHRLGFSTLINGLKELIKKQKNKVVRQQEIGLQTENAEEIHKENANVQIQADGQSFMHTESQTDSLGVYFTDICPMAGSAGLSGELASVPSGNTSASEPGLDWMKDTMAFSCVSEAAGSLNSKCCQPEQRENKRGNVSENIDPLQTVPQKQKLHVEEVQTKLNSGILKSIKRVGGKDFHKLVKKLGFSSSTALNELGDAHISLKIKLKRRRGALWEIVSVQEGNVAEGSSASGTCQAIARQTCSHNKNGATCSQPQKNIPEVPLSPNPPNPRQALGTVTLTPPSDLTLSPPHTPIRDHPSSPVQIALLSPGEPQAEESDEHIARLLEDMVMMGLNILPSGPMDRKSDIHHLSDKCVSPELHLDLKIGQAESFGTDAAPCLCVDGQRAGELGVGKILSSSGSSAQGETGAKCPNSEGQFRHGTMDLKNVISSPLTAFAIAKDADAPLSTLPFSTEDLELPHQNVGQLKNALDNLPWTANYFVQSVKQTRSHETSLENVQSSGTATKSTAHSDLARVNTFIQTNSGSVNSAVVKQHPEDAFQRDSKGLPEDSNLKRLELSKKSLGFDRGYSSVSNVGRTDLNEMRLPRCLSPLASEDAVLDGVSKTRTILPCTVSLKPDLRHQIFSIETEPLSGKTNKQSPHTQKAESVSGHSSCNLGSRQGCIKKTNKGRHGLRQCLESSKKPVLRQGKGHMLTRTINESGVKSGCTKRSSVDHSLDEPKKKKCTMLDCDSSEVNTQTVETNTTCSTSGKAAEGIKSAKRNKDHCSKNTYWLRPGKTVKNVQTDQQFKKKLTNLQKKQSCQSKHQDKCTDDVVKKESAVAKRGRKRASKKEKHLEGLRDNKSEYQMLQETESTGKQKIEENREQEQISSKPISDLTLKKQEKKHHSCHSKGKGIVDQVFHQTIFSVGSTVAGCLPSIDQKLQSSSLTVKLTQKTERKRDIGPALPHIVKKFRKLVDLDYSRGGKLISGKEENVLTEKSQAEEVSNKVKAKDVLGNYRTDKNMVNENNSKHLRTCTNGNGCLVDENSQREIDKNQMDTTSEAGKSSVDTDNLKTNDLNATIPLTGNCGSNSKIEKIKNLQSETSKTRLQDTKMMSYRTMDIPLKECERSANTQAVHQDVNQDCKKQQEEGNLEMGAECVKKISEQNTEHEAEESGDVEMMEECALGAADCGDEAATSGCSNGKIEIEVEKCQSGVELINEQCVALEAELRGPLCLRTQLQINSSNEENVVLMHTHSSATTVEEALSIQLKEKSEQTILCDDDDEEEEEDEEVVVDDLLSDHPGILPHSLAETESVTVLIDGEEKSEEEEEVDVTGEDTE